MQVGVPLLGNGLPKEPASLPVRSLAKGVLIWYSLFQGVAFYDLLRSANKKSRYTTSGG